MEQERLLRTFSLALGVFYRTCFMVIFRTHNIIL